MLSYMCIGLTVNYPLFLSELMKFEFLDRFSKILISNFVKIRPVLAKLFCVDGQTDMTKLIVAFRSCANAPKNQ
jgi:hypothetical protein